MGEMSWFRTQAVLSWFSEFEDIRLRTDIYHHHLDRSWRKFNRFSGGPNVHTLLYSDPAGGQGAVFLDILRGNEDSQSDDQQLMIGINHRVFHAMGVQSKLLWSLYTPKFSNHLEFGIRYHQDNVTRNHTEDAFLMTAGDLVASDSETMTLLHADSRARALAMYIHNDLAFDKLHLYPGLRLELVEGNFRSVDEDWNTPTFRPTLLPGFGALYAFDDWMNVFAGVHEGFSVVSPGQPQEIQPEKSINYEAGFRLQEDQTHIEIVGFYNQYSNITGQCTFSGGCSDQSIDQQFNGGLASIYGVESLFHYSIYPTPDLSFPLEATYTYTDGGFQTGFQSNYPQFGTVSQGDFFPYVAKHQARVQLGVNYQALSLHSGLHYRSTMLDEAGLFDTNTAILDSILLMDVSLKYEWKQYMISFSGNNLLNDAAVSSWRPFGARPIAPRQFFVDVRYRQ